MGGGDRRIWNLVLIGRGEGMGLHGLAHVERMIRREEKMRLVFEVERF